MFDFNTRQSLTTGGLAPDKYMAGWGVAWLTIVKDPRMAETETQGRQYCY